MIDFRRVLIPDRMKHLECDRRGYPIFFTALRDDSGRAHFQINNTDKRNRCFRRDLCSICGGRLLRGRWFVGGPKCAFDIHGAYLDPPMHQECVHYALLVCPYLAAPNYAKLIGRATLPADDALSTIDQQELLSPTTADDVRPDLFVAVHARGQRLERTEYGIIGRPFRPYIKFEYWRHGRQLTPEEIASWILLERRTGPR